MQFDTVPSLSNSDMCNHWHFFIQSSVLHQRLLLCFFSFLLPPSYLPTSVYIQIILCALSHTGSRLCCFVRTDPVVHFLVRCRKRRLNQGWFGFVRFGCLGFLCLSWVFVVDLICQYDSQVIGWKDSSPKWPVVCQVFNLTHCLISSSQCQCQTDKLHIKHLKIFVLTHQHVHAIVIKLSTRCLLKTALLDVICIAVSFHFVTSAVEV